MRHNASKALYRHWIDARGTRAAPEWTALDPTAFGSALPDVFTLDVAPANGCPPNAISFAGTRFAALSLGDPVGRSFLEPWIGRDRHDMEGWLAAVTSECIPVIGGGKAQPQEGLTSSFEILLLPLKHLGRTHAKMMGVLSFEETPTWLGLSPLESMTLRTARTILPEAIALDAARVKAPVAPRRPSLRLIVGGRA